MFCYNINVLIIVCLVFIGYRIYDGGENNLETSECTEMALERVLQQLNSQGLFGISILEADNLYGFHDQLIPTPTATPRTNRIQT